MSNAEVVVQLVRLWTLKEAAYHAAAGIRGFESRWSASPTAPPFILSLRLGVPIEMLELFYTYRKVSGYKTCLQRVSVLSLSSAILGDCLD